MIDEDRHGVGSPSMDGETDPLISVRDLAVTFGAGQNRTRAVTDVSWDLYPGEVVGIVGESGSGKSASALSILGLLPPPPRCEVGGSVRYQGQELLGAPDRLLRQLRGAAISMIFQDPISSLNPLHTVGHQIGEAISVHNPRMSRAHRRQRVVELLADVGIPDPQGRAEQHPHEFSGGMRQRAMIAMAMANKPRVLIADEPTTALDVTIQAQIVQLLRQVRDETGTAVLLITHDLGLIAEVVDRVIVMYGGRVVEEGPVVRVFEQPHHPYTVGLLRSMPTLEDVREELPSIPGQPPDPAFLPSGCSFHPRCPLGRGRDVCHETIPPLADVAQGGSAACHFHTEVEDVKLRLFDDPGFGAAGQVRA